MLTGDQQYNKCHIHSKVVLTLNNRVYFQVELCYQRGGFNFKIANCTFMFIKISHFAGFFGRYANFIAATLKMFW